MGIQCGLWCLINICAACRLESVWTVPSIDSTTGQVVFPLGAYFTTLAAAQKFYNLVNLRPQTIFSESGGLSVSASSFEPPCCLSDSFCSKMHVVVAVRVQMLSSALQHDSCRTPNVLILNTL